MRHKTLRVPVEVAEEITRRARIRGVPDADYYRLLIERGLLLESVDLALEKPIPPAYWAFAKPYWRPETSCVPWLPHASTARFRRPRSRPKTNSSA
jgi:hypothetical protein